MDPEDIHILGSRISRGLDSMLKGHKELTSNDTGRQRTESEKSESEGAVGPSLDPRPRPATASGGIVIGGG